MTMDSLLSDLSEHECSTTPLVSSSLMSVTPGREHSVDEEKLSRVLIERVLPPFSKSLKLQALVVYQADREKMNCLLVNRNYEKISPQLRSDSTSLEMTSAQSNGLDEVSDVSDSGYMDSIKMVRTPQTPSPKLTVSELMESGESTESVDVNHSTSRRKRKLCRPCKIPQNGSLISETSGSVTVDEIKIPRLDTTTTTVTSTLISTNSIISTSTVKSATNITSSSELLPFTTKSISDSVILPVTAVTLLPRVSVFSLPVTVLSTLPRPILPRISHDKPPITVTTIPATSMLPTSATLSQPIPLSRASESATLTLRTSECVNNSATVTGTINASDLSNRRFGKSFLCNQCRRDFASLSLLCAHTFAVHRCFRCTICDAQFTQRSNLQRHSLRHVGFKPFICKVCDKAYYRKDHLVRHIELSHPGRDPRLSLTVKLSSAECLDYLERLQSEGNEQVEQVQMLCQTPDETGPKKAQSPSMNGGESVEVTEVVAQTSPEHANKGDARWSPPLQDLINTGIRILDEITLWKLTRMVMPIVPYVFDLLGLFFSG
ncbi:unnamed protein product [Echinostoma caproni]|uniref:Zinc finger protein n=1 Tax=Echinostoma caproni TaxID=27848 RepID=A0A182ZZ75_9TREM|nr:unnamed protein product [Echinostoma caproni]